MKWFLFLLLLFSFNFILAEEAVVEITAVNDSESLIPYYETTFSDSKCAIDCAKKVLNYTFIMNGTDVSGDIYLFVDLLKGMNYGLSEELAVCEEKLTKHNFNKTAVYISVIISLILIIWKTTDVINARRSK